MECATFELTASNFNDEPLRHPTRQRAANEGPMGNESAVPVLSPCFGPQAAVGLRRDLQDQFDAERVRNAELEGRAATEADGRRERESQMKRDRRTREEAAGAHELDRRRVEEQQRVREAADAATRPRLEEEFRDVALATEETRAREEAAERALRRQATARALQRSAEARHERQTWERVRDFLAKYGFGRHVRAKSTRWTKDKTYPLHRAVHLNDAEMVELLLHFGADPAKANSLGSTPLCYAWSLADKDRGVDRSAVIALLEGWTETGAVSRTKTSGTGCATSATPSTTASSSSDTNSSSSSIVL